MGLCGQWRLVAAEVSNLQKNSYLLISEDG